MQPYTYLIHHIPTNQYYYGGKWSKDADPNKFWVNYFTSSKLVHELINRYGEHSFTIKIRKLFKTPEECRRWEKNVLKRLRVWQNPAWINLSCGSPPLFKGSRVGQGKGRKLSESHKNAIGKGNLGIPKPQTQDHINKRAKAMTGHCVSEDTRKKISRSGRRARQTIFSNGDQIFCGSIIEFAEKYNFNPKYVSTGLCKNRKYKGWIRV